MDIMLRLDISDILNMCMTNESYSRICLDDYFWRLRTEQDYSDFLLDHPKPESIQWKDYYIELYSNNLHRVNVIFRMKVIGSIWISRKDDFIKVKSNIAHLLVKEGSTPIPATVQFNIAGYVYYNTTLSNGYPVKTFRILSDGFENLDNFSDQKPNDLNIDILSDLGNKSGPVRKVVLKHDLPPQPNARLRTYGRDVRSIQKLLYLPTERNETVQSILGNDNHPIKSQPVEGMIDFFNGRFVLVVNAFMATDNRVYFITEDPALKYGPGLLSADTFRISPV